MYIACSSNLKKISESVSLHWTIFTKIDSKNYETIYVPLMKEEQELPTNNDSNPKEEVNTNTESGVTNGQTN